MPNSALPKHLQNRPHEDWTFPFKYIPRAWTSFKLSQPPKLLFGRKVLDWTSRKYTSTGVSLAGPDPTQKSKWAFAFSWPFHFTISFGSTGYYMRVGFRWDTIDEYYTFPAFVIKDIDGGLIEKEEMRITYRGYSRWAKD